MNDPALPSASTEAPEAIRTWLSAAAQHDAGIALAALAEGVTLHSPVTEGFVFQGRGEVGQLLSEAFKVAGTYRIGEVRGAGAVWFCVLSSTLGDQPFHEAQQLTLDESGAIARIELFVRPLPALTAMAHRLGPVAARIAGQPVLARVLGFATRGLDAMARSGERNLVTRIKRTDGNR